MEELYYIIILSIELGILALSFVFKCSRIWWLKTVFRTYPLHFEIVEERQGGGQYVFFDEGKRIENILEGSDKYIGFYSGELQPSDFAKITPSNKGSLIRFYAMDTGNYNPITIDKYKKSEREIYEELKEKFEPDLKGDNNAEKVL